MLKSGHSVMCALLHLGGRDENKQSLFIRFWHKRERREGEKNEKWTYQSSERTKAFGKVQAKLGVLAEVDVRVGTLLTVTVARREE